MTTSPFRAKNTARHLIHWKHVKKYNKSLLKHIKKVLTEQEIKVQRDGCEKNMHHHAYWTELRYEHIKTTHIWSTSMECFIIDHRQIFSEAKLRDYDVINENNKSAREVEQKMKIKNNMGTYIYI